MTNICLSARDVRVLGQLTLQIPEVVQVVNLATLFHLVPFPVYLDWTSASLRHRIGNEGRKILSFAIGSHSPVSWLGDLLLVD